MLSKRKVNGLTLTMSALVFSLTGALRSAGQGAPSGFTPFTPQHISDGTASLVGHYNPSQTLRLAIVLRPPHWAEEQRFLQQLQTKGSPQFHHFLTAEQWNARFSPSVADEQAVVSWAQSQGLQVTHRYPNRLIVDVAAPVATLERAFGVTINSYQLPNRSFFSNDRDPQLPANLSGIVQTIIGLNNWERMHPANKNVNEPPIPDYSPGPVVGAPASNQGDGDGTGRPKKNGKEGGTPDITGGAYDPTDIYSSEAYDYNALYHLGHCCNPNGGASSPPEASIAVATVGSQNFGDIVGFHNQYAYLAWNITEIGIDGQSVPCNDSSDASCDGEGTMDMEWTTATANSFGASQNTAHVFMYDASSFDPGLHDAFNQMLTDGNARAASTSWSCTEIFECSSSFVSSLDSIFSSMVGQGWTIVAAQGDRGSTDDVTDRVDVAFPGTDPNVISAGGTTLTLDSFGNYVSEVTWTGGPDGAGSNDGGTGGGCSAIFSAPSYQSNQPCGPGSRGVPDIALNADWFNAPQNMYMDGLFGNGGTSIVAPELAGFFAQENAYLLALGNICGSGSSPCAPMGDIHYALYFEGLDKGAPHYPFFDITSGCNNNDVTAFFGLGYYCAGPGYDLVTGWGSANMLQLAWTINWYHIPGFTYPSVAFSGPATSRWYNTEQVVSWTVNAPPQNVFPSDGIAGFSQAWDSDPGDATSEATPGAGSSFYSGPQYANATTGCLDFTGASCAGSVGQGWHTVNVRAWGNEGENGGGDYTYGPLGYDTIAPVTTASLSGTLVSGTSYKSAVKVTLTPTDPGAPTTGSGVASTVYQVNSEGLHAYTGPFTVSFPGTYTVTFHSTDVAGNVEATESRSFSISSVISLSPGNLAFGNQPFGTTSAAKSVTLTNIGSGSVKINSIVPSGDFAVPTNTCTSSLAGGAHCTISVTFKPSVTGSVTGDVTVNYPGEGSPQRVGLTGTGLGPITLSPTSLSFGTITVGSTSPEKTVTLTNNETTSLNISHTASGDYSIASTTCGATLGSKASCTMKITFHPKQNGAADGAVTVTYNAGFSPQEVALSGSGTGGVASPLTFTPSSLSFGNVPVGASASKTVTVKNNSASTVTISKVAASGDYTATGCSTTLAALKTCTMTVTFKPSVKGTINGSAAITDNTIVSPEIYDISGTGVSPLSLSTNSLSFGTLTVGTSSASQSLTLTNNLGSAMSLTHSASGDYAVAGGTCGTTLAAHKSCNLSVTFTPTTTGAISGVVTVTYGSTFSPEEVALNGTGE
jgi:Pro-kumamolisin, activation domain/Abnormal spindle-like microcephaly-assoc'd, ASPM-SPD-2-Hydin